MCLICASFNPYLNECVYDGLNAPDPQIEEYIQQAELQLQSAQVDESGDAGATTATTAGMNSGDVFHGTISNASDSDWVEVTLTEGQEYTVMVVNRGALSDGIENSVLNIRDSAGTVQHSNDDLSASDDYYISKVTFTVPTVADGNTTETYYLDVSGSGSFTGDYAMSVTAGDKASFDAQMGAGILLTPNASWTTTPGSGATVSWAIRDTLTDDPANPGNNTTTAMNATQITGTQTVMSYLDGVSGLTLNQVNPGGTSDSATILFGAYDTNDGRGGYAYYPDAWDAGTPNTGFGQNSGDVWINNNSSGVVGSYGYGEFGRFLLLHELGHAIGLAHPGPYNAGGGGPITYADNAEFVQDTNQYTVMSYFDETNSGVSGGLDYPDTFMLYDLLAIHQMYGADTAYNSGDTTYGFNATDGGSVYDFTANTTPFLSIYDGSGSGDKLDLSGYAMSQVVNLTEGSFSNIGGYTGNLSIAFGAVIEDATGGSAGDNITGNAADNELTGNGGDDTLLGGAGADSLVGGAGADSLVGGADADTIVGGDGNDQIDATQGADFVEIIPIAGSTLTATGNALATLRIYDAGAVDNGSQITASNGAVINHSGFGSVQMLCFCAGTQIATPDGAALVERLRIGDAVRTAGGAVRPVKWVGRQTIVKAFAGEAARTVRIAAGALGGGLPTRDLCLTGDHGVALDGLLINAAALVNGRSITLEPLSALPERFTLYHIELEGHALILANGTPSETYLDLPGRRAFDNFQEYLDLYGPSSPAKELPLPRISAPRLLPRDIQARLSGARCHKSA